jgi:undecaprenyl-diphosphatase
MQDRGEIWREVGAQARALDEATYEAIASTPTQSLDRALARLSDLADMSKPWLAIAAVLALVGGGRGRSAALDGVASIGLASALANLGVKPAVDRRRPERERDGRPFAEARSVRMPGSTSFPSGHTASAFAFSGAVGARIPALWVPLRLLAMLVGYSRVHTGVHYPGDVVAGALLGSACPKLLAAARRYRRRH